MIQRILCLLLLGALFACDVEEEVPPILNLEEVKVSAKAQSEADFKTFLETEEGQHLITKKLQRGGEGTGECNCYYAIQDVEVGAAPDQDFEYILWSPTDCDQGNPLSCVYFSGLYSTIYPECGGATPNPDCGDVLDGTLPVYPTSFDCSVSQYSSFGVNFSAIGVNVEDCLPKLIGPSSITFTIICCDQAANPDSDLNDCGRPSQCYVSDPITIDLEGGWDTQSQEVISLEGCGCVPRLR